GVVTSMMRAPFETADLADLMRFHNPKLDDGRTLDLVANELCAKVCDSLDGTVIGRNVSPPPPEAYTVFCFKELDRAKDVNAWLTERRRDIAGLLTETLPQN